MKQKLVKILKCINQVETMDYDLGWLIYDMVVNDSVIIKDIEKNSFHYPEFLTFDIKDKNLWITYRNARKLKFWIENETLFVLMNILEPATDKEDYFFNARFKWGVTIELPMSFIKKKKKIILNDFDEYCKKQYAEYLKTMEESWIENFKKQFLD